MYAHTCKRKHSVSPLTPAVRACPRLTCMQHLYECHCDGVDSLREVERRQRAKEGASRLSAAVSSSSLGKAAAGSGKGTGVRKFVGLGKGMIGRVKHDKRSHEPTGQAAAQADWGRTSAVVAAANKRLRGSEQCAEGLLHHKEKELCASIGLTAEKFVHAKRTLITEAMHTVVDRANAVSLLKNQMDAVRAGMVWKLCVANSVISV
mmetsp:Transcript_42272/g.99034  ORF Transcript_42272/g.99034 Transcript_42272/m.99034 type:complete len:206 (-) Transcript_42272:83-700(-)